MSFFDSGKVQHYYGDYVRQIFILCAVLLAVAIPVAGNLLPFGIYFQISSVVVFVILAGLISPTSPVVMTLAIIVSAIGVILFEGTAITNYGIDTSMLFWTREVMSVLLLFSLYYSVKTVRSMAQHQLHLKRPPHDLGE